MGRLGAVSMRLAVTTVLAIGLTAIADGPAFAANKDGVCNSSEACMYEDAGADRSKGIYDTTSSYLSNYASSTYVYGSSATLNDTVTALQNNHGTLWQFFYVASNGGGFFLSEQPDGYRLNLALDLDPEGKKFDNRFSSHCRENSTPSWGCEQ